MDFLIRNETELTCRWDIDESVDSLTPLIKPRLYFPGTGEKG
jgi:hypothetical protein